MVEPASLAETINNAQNTTILSSINEGGMIPIFDRFYLNHYVVYPTPIKKNLLIASPLSGLNTKTAYVLFKWGADNLTIQYQLTATGSYVDLKDISNNVISEQLIVGKVYLLAVTVTYSYGSAQSVVGALTELEEDSITFTVQ